MSVSVRAKRVTAPFGDETGAGLRCAGESSCVGDGGVGDGGASTCLSALVHAFLETAGRRTTSFVSNDDGSEGDATDPDESLEEGGASDSRDHTAMETVRDLMFPALDPDPFRRRLATDVSREAEALTWLRSGGGESAFRRTVMARLRATGYNAGICKARWDASGGLAAGSYEYIDVVEAAAAERAGQGKGRRHIVDLDFAAEFKVARATEEYKAVVAALPPVAVAGEEAFRRVVREVADAARRSLRTQGLHVPPWRKSRYMLAKWLGPHRRTTSTVPPAALRGESKCREYNRLQAAPGPGGGDAHYRAVGFSMAPLPTARTR
ncbi:uncharacterized protein LOC141825006 [Curcuma longa]|uniref:uncharacterized protein LOC141825006 n=1 Tax=Curcuma longa TaxID=136217 RepID=UPI003D9EFB7E